MTNFQAGDHQEIRACLDQKLYAPAFDLIVKNFSGKVMRLAYSILGNRALAEDLTQDVFVRIWRALPAYRGLSSVSTWIYSITRNTCLTALKRDRAKNAISAISLDEPLIRAEAESEAFLPRGSSVIDLQSLLSKVPEKHRQVLMLFYMEEKSYEEVARQLDLPIGTVKTYLYRARKTLMSLLLQEKKGGNV
jgi:RNA polymerase sigma-70 factor (ECF subfamily)